MSRGEPGVRFQVSGEARRSHESARAKTGGATRVRWWPRPIAATLLFLLTTAATAAPAAPAAPDWPDHPGDFHRAAGQLEKALQATYPGSIFTFGAGPVKDPRAAAIRDAAAKELLALYSMGKISAHSPALKRAFTCRFLTAFGDRTRQLEAIELYERIAVPNADDPFWRIMRARCARLLDLSETLQLYEQVLQEMAGVPPNDEVRQLWDATRAEFKRDAAATKAKWQQQSVTYLYDARGLDVAGAKPIDPFPLLNLEPELANKLKEWQDVLGESPKAQAMALDGVMAAAANVSGQQPWRDNTGVLNTERGLAMHLLAVPPTEQAELRAVQEAGYQEAPAGLAGSAPALDRFRRYRWSESAQRTLLGSARQHLFVGETQAAARCFEDVLRYAAPGALREEAQVGLWISLAQFAEPDLLARAFDGVSADATWPWNGKRAKTGTIEQQLVPKTVAQARAPSLASLKQHIVRLPPVRIGAGHRVFSVDMQRDGDRLLVSSPRILAVYAADNPAKPLWVQNKGAGRGMARLDGQRIVTPCEVGHRLVSLRRADGTSGHEGNPNGPYTRFRYSTIGGPAIVDNRAYAVQIGQDFENCFPRHMAGGTAHVALSCFGSNLEHLWTRRYEGAGGGDSERPRVSQGAVYFSSSAGYVIRADSRDGEMEWMHRYETYWLRSRSLWCLGGEPVVIGNTVVCLPKSSGMLFALDKETGRRRWTLRYPRAYELLGRHGDLVVLTGPNILCAIDAHTGKMQWGRQISPVWSEGFQLTHAQLSGDSVYCGTKNALFRFDARNGVRLESRPWKMGTEAPMSFLVAGSDLYVLSDQPLKDARRERQLVDYHTVIIAAAPPNKRIQQPLKLKDGSTVHWRDLVLMCIKDKAVLWSRFVCTASERGSGFGSSKGGMGSSDGKISVGWPGGGARHSNDHSAVHDAKTGQLLQMGNVEIVSENQ